ncbi:MAG: hydroxymethylglutaryl-CoA lyase [Pseudomonadota bacterium]
MNEVIINEVGPRDGLQSQQVILSPEQRIDLINALFAAGLTNIEVGSFVSPTAVPQMAGTDAVARGISVPVGANVSALIPNRKGYELARRSGVDTVAVVVSATETMNEKNIRMSLAQVMDVAEDIIARGSQEGAKVQAYLAVAFECPFEGKVDPTRVYELGGRLLEAGARELVIADTIGAADPKQVRSLMEWLVGAHGASRLACHFHDTRAMGLANVYAALESGVRRFDAAIGGLGGCPFAPGAKGNVATEDVVMMCEQLGYRTGINLDDLLPIVEAVSEVLGAKVGGRAFSWLKQRAA